ncbi:MAG TPA: ribosomal RNA small subunit methyltransferase A [Verrucomicrobiales bacterium]|nr:ribosomal RNA small subunit methyltransferase A [Verrucomicrobiales bacterium]
MKLTEMRQILQDRGIQLTKSLGQNFLHDENQLKRIVEHAKLTHDDQVLEVGPGMGPLTEWLVAYSAHVTAIELDLRLVEFLRERLVAVKNLTLIHADALHYIKSHPRDWSSFKLVANLPYSVASPLLVELAQGGRGPSTMVATLQLEVARRAVARPGTDDYGLLTLLLQLDYRARIAFRIPSGCFFPSPDVESAVLILEKRPTPLLTGPPRAAYTQLVRLGLSQRRKMMVKLLKQRWPEPLIHAACAAAKVPIDIRAEQVSLEQFVEMAQHLVQDP